MKNLNSVCLLALMFMTSIGSCNNDAVTKELNSVAMPCNVDGKIIKRVEDRVGTIYFHTVEKKYAIHTTFNGTFDSRDFGFLCNPIDSLKKDGLSVSFSGDYYPYEKDIRPPVGGATYYYLSVTKLKVNLL